MPHWSRCWRNDSRRSERLCDSQMNSACLRKPKRQWRSQCWLTRRGTGGLRMCRPPRVRNARQCWGRFRMREVRRRVVAMLWFVAILPLLSCSAKPDPNTLVMIIESSPTNLDPRGGVDAYSERIDNLIFDDLLCRGDDLHLAPGPAERWDIPDALTYVFHLHHGVKFHDGR